MRKAFTYKGCTVSPHTHKDAILVGCNDSVNRYLKSVWWITFPDKTWVDTGTKLQAKQYIDDKGDAHGVNVLQLSCPYSPDNEHSFSPDLEYDPTGQTINCDHCGCERE
jgi:hypothetical protein